MKSFPVVLISMLCFSITAAAKNNDTMLIALPRIEPVRLVASPALLINSNSAAKTTLGFSKQGRSLEAYYFPGTSNKRAIVIGGMHGSELSSIETAFSLIRYLAGSSRPYYSVVIIPALFPDNAAAAQSKPELIGNTKNHGRYTDDATADPNRQMPSLGKAFKKGAKDHLGRQIETENSLLLDLIDAFRPQRIVNIHAIRDTTKAGIYADPRTDENDIALGYDTDSSLAIEMANYIYCNGGYVPGNHMDSIPTSMYHCDYPAAEPGSLQQRNLHGSKLPGRRGEGVSLGSWAATAVCDESNPGYNRDAMRILTMELPGCKRSSDYTTIDQQLYMEKLIALYAMSIQSIFLEKYSEE